MAFSSQPAAETHPIPFTLPWMARVLLVALSLSIGWGIRGNFGHEIGAMLPGALAALAAVLISGRQDWLPRIAYFATAGAIGWSIGGSMSYMQVIAYTHSGHSLSQLYGFACLFVIGFVWAAPGGAATALPIFLNRSQLRTFWPPITAIATVWIAADYGMEIWDHVDPDFRHESRLYWYDTNWVQALGVLVAILGLAGIRRRWDFASSLFLHAAIGWWIGFLGLVVLAGLRMTPPRGDNWAGCIGLVAGLWAFFHRRKLPGINQASLVSGIVGGFGFAGAALFKLMGMATGLTTNWHSVLEQTYGFLNGIGIALAMFGLARRVPPVDETPGPSTSIDYGVIAFSLWGVSYLNLIQNTRVWVESKAVPATLYGIPANAWHQAAWIIAALAFIGIVIAHRKRPIALLPDSQLGRGQLLYLALLWVMVLGNFMRALPGFSPQRLITEGVIQLNAMVCSVGILIMDSPSPVLPGRVTHWNTALKRIAGIGIVFATVTILLEWQTVRVVYGDRFAGSSNLHIRFGPNANATSAKPSAGKPHP
jgi:hypothetical protein